MSSDPRTEQLERLLRTVITMVDEGKFKTGITSRVFTAMAFSHLAMGLVNNTVAWGLKDIRFYQATGSHYPHLQGSLIDWGKIDWSRYDKGGSPTDIFHNFLKSLEKE